MWVFPDENPPVKFKRNRSASKQMIVCFFANFGHVATIPLEDRKTVMADRFVIIVNHCLPEVFQAWHKRRPLLGVRGLLLHHDNASAHTAAVTLDFLAANDVQLVTHPPHSPDFAPCDWFLVPSAKRQLKGKQLQNVEDARAFFEGVILDTPQSTWSGVIDSLFERMVKCVQAKGGGGGGGVLRKTGVNRVVVSVVEKKQIAKHNE